MKNVTYFVFTILKPFGVEESKGNLFHSKIIEIFPNKCSLQILDKTTFDTDYIINISTVSKGLAGMEYLLYNDENSINNLNLLQEDMYRVSYLLAITKENLRQINLLINFWEQGYKTTFEGYKSLSCVENARCLAFNQLINIIDIIRVTKIGKPAGLEKSPNINLAILEAFRSRSSLKLIKSSFDKTK